jgi:hypothetical protein
VKLLAGVSRNNEGWTSCTLNSKGSTGWMMLNPILRHHLSSYLSRTVLTNVLHTVFLSKDLRPTAGKKFYVVKLVLAAVASFAGLLGYSC